MFEEVVSDMDEDGVALMESLCGDIEYSGNRQDIVTNPRFIAEILSKSTADYDRGGKFVHYRSIPGLADYMIAAQDSVCVEHWSRQPDGSWLLREFTSLADVVRIASIHAEVSLAAIYEDVITSPQSASASPHSPS